MSKEVGDLARSDLEDDFEEEDEDDATDLVASAPRGTSMAQRAQVEEVTFELFEKVLWLLMVGKERADGVVVLS